MSKRKRVPAPFNRILPSVIRTHGPRVLLIAGGIAALFVLTGGSYLLSRVSTMPSEAPEHKVYKKITAQTPPAAQVLGDSTETTSSQSQASTQSTAPVSSGSQPTPPVNTDVHSSGQAATSTGSSSMKPLVSIQTKGNSNSQGQSSGSQGSASKTVNLSISLGTLGLNVVLGL